MLCLLSQLLQSKVLVAAGLLSLPYNHNQKLPFQVVREIVSENLRKQFSTHDRPM